MAGLEALAGKSIYLDANIIIYLLEGFEPHKHALSRLLKTIEDGQVSCVTSELSMAEVLVRPFKEGKSNEIKTYIDALNDPRLVALTPVTLKTFVDAAFTRAETGLKLPDAIHVASALQTKCDAFLTNDKKIKTPNSLPIITLDDL